MKKIGDNLDIWNFRIQKECFSYQFFTFPYALVQYTILVKENVNSTAHKTKSNIQNFFPIRGGLLTWRSFNT